MLFTIGLILLVVGFCISDNRLVKAGAILMLIDLLLSIVVVAAVHQSIHVPMPPLPQLRPVVEPLQPTPQTRPRPWKDKRYDEH